MNLDFFVLVIPKVFLTRLQLIWSVLNPSSLMIVCFYSISGSIFVLLYLAIADGPYSTLTTICVEDRFISFFLYLSLFIYEYVVGRGKREGMSLGS